MEILILYGNISIKLFQLFSFFFPVYIKKRFVLIANGRDDTISLLFQNAFRLPLYFIFHQHYDEFPSIFSQKINMIYDY